MGEIQTFENYGCLAVSDVEHPRAGKYDGRLGVVYAVEFGDKVKVGCTTNIKRRMSHLRTTARGYALTDIGRIAFTDYCRNWYQCEKEAHTRLAKFRMGSTELFDVDFDSACDVLRSLDVMTMTMEEIDAAVEESERSLEEFKERMDNAFGIDALVSPRVILDGITIIAKRSKDAAYELEEIYAEHGDIEDNQTLGAAALGFGLAAEMLQEILSGDAEVDSVIDTITDEDKLINAILKKLWSEIEFAGIAGNDCKVA